MVPVAEGMEDAGHAVESSCAPGLDGVNIDIRIGGNLRLEIERYDQMLIITTW
jgi:hypothetical protein